MADGFTMIVKCPRCGKETEFEDNPFRPFCCQRCKYADLGDWFEGTHTVPGKEADEVEKAPDSKESSGDS